MAVNTETEEIAMTIIANAGGARSLAIDAIHQAKSGDFASAASKLKDAEAALLKAHQAQTKLLTQEAEGKAVKLSLLLVHAQDHLMNAVTVKDLAQEIIALYQK
jgi:PTS system cellobiose-specific IIA component